MYDHDPVVVIISYAIVVALLLLPLYVAKQLLPTAYRFVQRLARRIGKPATKFLAGVLFMSQVKRRGWLHGLFVHVPLVCGVITLVTGLITATIQALIIGLLCIVTALMAHRVLTTLRRLRSRRSRLPGWRR